MKKILAAHRGIFMRIYWLPLKATEFDGVDATSFFKNLMVLMYLFIFVVFFEVILLKKRESHCYYKINWKEKISTEKIIF